MNENTVSQRFAINLQNIGQTPDNRQLYYMNYANQDRIRVSVNNNDKDSFEKCVSAINQLGKNIDNPEELRKNKIKAYSALFGLGITGIAVPAYLTRNSKVLTKALSIIGGAALGVIAGMVGFAKSIIPKGFKEAQSAQQMLQTLDVKIENVE